MTYAQFTAALRKRGWKSAGQGCYVHTETGTKAYLYNGVRYKGRMVELWQWHVAHGTYPEPRRPAVAKESE